MKRHYENKKYSNYSIFSLMATCNTCASAIVGAFDVYDESYGQDIKKARSLLEVPNQYNLTEILGTKDIEFYPNERKTAEIPGHLPESVKEELLTAEDLFLEVSAKPHFIKPAGNAYRSTLERALCELAENDNRAKLNKRIEKLFDDGKLTKDLKNFALHIRTLSAEASHAYNDFTLEELRELRLFIQLFLQYTFTLPAMIPDESKADTSTTES
ncbi:DUF4145 domain-containing protein [Glaesserella parasuis]|uniref:DUF4145 domain-containing protein n=1 Tax=Glaesserella parasuis TaxID=738 RepID=UPI002436DD83|nr:DUF4145 domain-containing protein [Glaesserella parasuis]MDG6341247.1 DUF4145 domain-containing protein [Glaesserella parasuis]MDG6367332.1 DUF4145 domain-containing protein [Glaesserella parasuis]MDP0013786.1 DUF4145 domain-containing protein [Glaesserella parasuis]MDP0149316.1 DUF4145 domain-containing protein [Glaesserella parasuis]